MAAESDLDAAVNNLAAAIKQATIDPKPNYTVDGQTVNWGDYLHILTTKMETLVKVRQLVAGPYQRMTRMKSK